MAEMRASLPYVVLSLPGAFLYFNTKPALAIGAVLLLAAVSLYHGVRYPDFNRLTQKTTAWISLIFCILFLSYLLSGQDMAHLFSYAFLRYNGSIFSCFIPLIALLFLKVDVVKLARVFFSVTFLVSAVICALGIIEFFIGKSTLLLKDEGIGFMFVGLNHSHNATGSITAVLGVAVLVFALFENIPAHRFRYLICLALFYAALILTLSRGSFLAFLISVSFLLIVARLEFNRRVLEPIVVLLLISILIMPMTNYLDRVRSLLNDQFYHSDKNHSYMVASLVSPPTLDYVERLRVLCDPGHPLDRNNSAKYRGLLTRYAIELFKDSPIIGIGFGRFDDSILSHVNFSGKKHLVYVVTAGNPISTDCNAHNSYLHFLAEVGLVGTLVIIGFWIKILVNTYEGVRVAHNDEDRLIFGVGFMSLLTLFLLAFTEHYFAAPTVMLFVSYITGLCVNRLGQIHQTSPAF